MKICLISPLYEPWLIGGAENYIVRLSNELVKNNQVVVITLRGPKPRTNFVKINPKIIEMDVCNVELLYNILSKSSVGILKKSLWHLLDIWNFSSYKSMQKILQQEKPDIVHINGIKGLSSSVISVIKNLGLPHVLTLHDYELISRWAALYRQHAPITNFNFLDRIYINYMKRISSYIDTVISPSKFVMNFHTKLGFFKNSKKIVVPNGVDIINEMNPKTKLSGDFLFIGNIMENKGVHVAIQAFKKLKNKNLKLHIVGKGPYLDNIKKIIDKNDPIKCHGFVNELELEKFKKNCSYAIIPSIWYENFPLVVYEVMSNGLPVLASKIGGLPELVIDGHNGFLFEPGNVNSLSKLIDNKSQNEELFLKLSKNSITSAQKFTMKDHLCKILEIYQDTINSKKSSA